MEQALQVAEQALSSGNFEEAILKYTAILSEQGDNQEALLGRSQAYLLEEDYLAALSDAKKVLEQDPQNAKACYRKGVACYEMDELETAMNALEIGLKNAGGEVMLQKKMEKLLEKCQNAAQEANEQEDEQSPNINEQTADVPQPLQPPQPVPVTPKYRHQHYQTPQAMNIDVFAKNLTPERLNIEFTEDTVSVVINSQEGEHEYSLNVELYAPIVPDLCKFEILRSKVEICMRKKDGDLQWPTLEKSEIMASNNFSKGDGVAQGYPSSSRHKKDWANLDQEGKELEENEKPEGDAAVQALFQKIYANADENTRRAMMKSYMESNGTVLSTNWEEVGSKKVECTPPDGMELKKFEY